MYSPEVRVPSSLSRRPSRTTVWLTCAVGVSNEPSSARAVMGMSVEIMRFTGQVAWGHGIGAQTAEPEGACSILTSGGRVEGGKAFREGDRPEGAADWGFVGNLFERGGAPV